VRGFVDRRLVIQDCTLEPLQCLARLDPELLDERLPRRLIDLECFDLTTGAVEREHQLAAQSFLQRVLRDEYLQLGDQRFVTAELQVGLDTLGQRRHPELVQPLDVCARELFVGEVGERWPVPERERRAQGRRRARGIACGERAPRVGNGLVEAVGVEFTRLYAQLVAMPARQ
jgi:hypothetical protein